MAKIFDKIIFILIILVVFSLWAYYITRNLFVALGISITLTLVIMILTRRKKQPIDTNAYVTKITLSPYSEQRELFYKILSPSTNKELLPNGLIKIFKNCLFLPYLKLTIITPDEIYKKAIFAKKLGFEELTLILNAYDEKAFLPIRDFLPITVKIISTHSAIPYLQRANALPHVTKKQKIKPKLTTLFKTSFKRQNAKFYLLSGITLGFLAYVTPLTLYYLVFSSITLSFAGLCFFKKREKTEEIFL